MNERPLPNQLSQVHTLVLGPPVAVDQRPVIGRTVGFTALVPRLSDFIDLQWSDPSVSQETLHIRERHPEANLAAQSSTLAPFNRPIRRLG
jgi:hypothetical protein